MTRMTIDYGIDLGTTNSSIAVLKGTDVEVFKNNDGSEYTPSAVWVDKSDRLIVGRRAKDRFFDDEENAACEFKLLMGSGTERLFKRSGRKMTPEDLSSWVLKQLKADVRQRCGEDVLAAVITVPADFELPACMATERAAKAAGFVGSPLLQEPVAAALAYGFQSEDENLFWLVYDLGGGTFDAAVIHMRDGQFQVVNHGGDRNLGGKLIDWEIVNQVLVPAVAREHNLSDFRQSNPKWTAAFAKLKLEAEKAKIAVSRDETAEIILDYLCNDDRGQPVRFEFELKRTDVERIAEPLVLRSINICRKALAEKRLVPGNVQKVLLVGGPTLMPYLRDRLADKQNGLGIPLEFGIDPLTVVARGAAIFAGTRRLEGVAIAPLAHGQLAVHLDYQPMSPETEPLLGGKVESVAGEPLAGFTIEFINREARTPWRSGKVTLGANATFLTTLWAEKGGNTFVIELCDATGNRREAVPAQFPYRLVPTTAGDTILIHSVGVALANNERLPFVNKGTSLPARRRVEGLRTVADVHCGQSQHILSIPVVEGEHERRADRNRLVGVLSIPGDKIRRDLPAGSQVEVTIEINQSRSVLARAYIPFLDEEIENVMTLDKGTPDRAQLHRDFEREKKRIEQLRQNCQEVRNPKALKSLQRIEGEGMEHDIDAAMNASELDRDAVYRARDRLADLRNALDEAEDALEWPTLVIEAEREVEVERNIVNRPEFGVTSEEQQMFNALERELQVAKQSRDADLLRAKIREMDRLGLVIVYRQPGWWVEQLERLEQKKNTMNNASQAEDSIAQGRRAIDNDDFAALIAAVRQLASLLPVEDADRGRYPSSLQL
ncbi:MAG: Hsp70 family protein [Planctomycetes bacterium]|nr:Hsp70 family protein [Planctomycetota bacterium]